MFYPGDKVKIEGRSFTLRFTFLYAGEKYALFMPRSLFGRRALIARACAAYTDAEHYLPLPMAEQLALLAYLQNS